MCRALVEGGKRCAGRHGLSDRTLTQTRNLLEQMGGATPFPRLNSGQQEDHDGPKWRLVEAENPDGYESEEDATAGESETDRNVREMSIDDMRAQIEEMREKLLTMSPDAVKLARETEDADVLRLLAEAPDPEVVDAVEQNPHTPEELKEELPELRADARTRWDRVKEVLSGFGDDEYLARHADDPSVWVKLAVLTRSNIGPQTIAKLSQDSNPFVRFSVGLLPATPKRVWEELKDDNHPLVKFGARGRADRYRKDLAKDLQKRSLVSSLTEKEKLRMAGNPRTNPELLNDIQMFEKDRELLSAVASNPNTPAKALADLHEYHGGSDILVGVGANRNTPENTLRKLSDHRDADIRGSVASNPNTPKEVLEEMSRTDKSPAVRAGIASNSAFVSDPSRLADLAKDRSWQVKRAVAMNGNTTPDVLADLGRSRDSRVKLAVAGHPKTPEATLTKLSRHKDEEIAKLAQKQIIKRLAG